MNLLLPNDIICCLIFRTHSTFTAWYREIVCFIWQRSLFITRTALSVGRQPIFNQYFSLPWVGVHAFYFSVLQFILRTAFKEGTEKVSFSLQLKAARWSNVKLFTGDSCRIKTYWLRLCATNQKIAGSIPEGVLKISHWHNPSGRTMALGSAQPLTEMGTRNFSRG